MDVGKSVVRDDHRACSASSGWRFISSVDALAGKPYCISHDEYLHLAGKGKLPNSIEFISLQDLKGFISNGLSDKTTIEKKNAPDQASK